MATKFSKNHGIRVTSVGPTSQLVPGLGRILGSTLGYISPVATNQRQPFSANVPDQPIESVRVVVTTYDMTGTAIVLCYVLDGPGRP